MFNSHNQTPALLRRSVVPPDRSCNLKMLRRSDQARSVLTLTAILALSFVISKVFTSSSSSYLPKGEEFVTLNNGVKMPAVASGLWRVASSAAADVVKMSFDVGYVHIDTAIYYANLKEAGHALSKRPRKSFFLTAKIDPNIYGDKVDTTDNSYTYFYGPDAGLEAGSKAKGNEYHAFTTDNAYDWATQEMNANLRDLQTPFVDLMLVHWPPKDGNCEIIRETWRAMEDFLEAGKARAIGVSNFCPSSLDCLLKTAKVVPAVNQVAYHVGIVGGPDPGGIKSYCDAHGIVLQAYSPLAVGTPGAAATLINGELVTEIGKAHGKTGPQVALRWVWQHGVPLATRSTSRGHLAQNKDLFGWALSEEEMAKLDAATEPAADYSFMCKER